MVKRTISVGIVLYKGDSVLLVRHTEMAKPPTGSYGFPAGRVNEGETLYDAAIRELEEETGLTTSRQHLIQLPEKTSNLPMKSGSEDFIFQPFLCTEYSGKLRPSEKTVPEFVKLDCLGNLFLISDDVIEISRQWYKAPSPSNN